MARKKSDAGDSILFGILIGICVAVIIFITVAPLALISMYLYGFILVFRYRLIISKNGKSVFWLSDNEKIEFYKKHVMLSEALKKINLADKEAKNKDISKNIDGQYSARSKVGKTIRDIIDYNNNIIDDNMPRYKELEFKPYKKWKKFARAFAIKKSSLIALVVWGVGVCYYSANFGKTFEIGLKQFFRFPIELIGGNKSLDYELFVVLGITALSIFTAYFGMEKLSNGAKTIIEEPPLVSIENYKSYDANA